MELERLENGIRKIENVIGNIEKWHLENWKM